MNPPSRRRCWRTPPSQLLPSDTWVFWRFNTATISVYPSRSRSDKEQPGRAGACHLVIQHTEQPLGTTHSRRTFIKLSFLPHDTRLARSLRRPLFTCCIVFRHGAYCTMLWQAEGIGVFLPPICFICHNWRGQLRTDDKQVCPRRMRYVSTVLLSRGAVNVSGQS